VAAPAESPPATAPEGTVLELREGRSLTLESSGADELVEIRSASGSIELRIRLTEDGPVLEMESVRLVLRADQSIDVEAERFNVRTSGDINLAAEGEGEVRVTGALIHLN
jgi:hypothetical protein